MVVCCTAKNTLSTRSVPWNSVVFCSANSDHLKIWGLERLGTARLLLHVMDCFWIEPQIFILQVVVTSSAHRSRAGQITQPGWREALSRVLCFRLSTEEGGIMKLEWAGSYSTGRWQQDNHRSFPRSRRL